MSYLESLLAAIRKALSSLGEPDPAEEALLERLEAEILVLVSEETSLDEVKYDELKQSLLELKAKLEERVKDKASSMLTAAKGQVAAGLGSIGGFIKV